jgi:hypothetical protein
MVKAADMLYGEMNIFFPASFLLTAAYISKAKLSFAFAIISAPVPALMTYGADKNSAAAIAAPIKFL